MFRVLRQFCQPALRYSAKRKFNCARRIPRDSASEISSRNYAIGKFYKTTNIVENNDGTYGVLLDNSKLLKTPAGRELTINSRALALAVAEEWNSQRESVRTDSMHLTKLCFFSVDNPNEHSEKDVAQQILSYLETDTVLFISDNDEELEKLLNDKWLPAIDKFNRYFEIDLKPSKGICIVDDGGVNENTKRAVERYLLSLGFPALHGVLQAVETLKSLILTTCCLHRDVNVKDAVLLSKLEEEYQCTKWGRVDWIKDYSDADSVVRLSAAMLFVYYTALHPKHKPKSKRDDHHHHHHGRSHHRLHQQQRQQ